MEGIVFQILFIGPSFIKSRKKSLENTLERLT